METGPFHKSIFLECIRAEFELKKNMIKEYLHQQKKEYTKLQINVVQYSIFIIMIFLVHPNFERIHGTSQGVDKSDQNLVIQIFDFIRFNHCH